MKVKVSRMTRKAYDELVKSLGPGATFIEIPATVPDIGFQGVFTNALKHTVAIPWPVDRPDHAQRDFAETYCQGGFPVDFFERKRNHNFKFVKGGKE